MMKSDRHHCTAGSDSGRIGGSWRTNMFFRSWLMSNRTVFLGARNAIARVLRDPPNRMSLIAPGRGPPTSASRTSFGALRIDLKFFFFLLFWNGMFSAPYVSPRRICFGFLIAGGSNAAGAGSTSGIFFMLVTSRVELVWKLVGRFKKSSTLPAGCSGWGDDALRPSGLSSRGVTLAGPRFFACARFGGARFGTPVDDSVSLTSSCPFSMSGDASGVLPATSRLWSPLALVPFDVPFGSRLDPLLPE
mmetsp:Transcript_37520/g.88760  ORF Transcript_37520/g.88760 Transcript_37520/m.88760 type:complete len:247 (+) Transcript_37520:2390-3130(+)